MHINHRLHALGGESGKSSLLDRSLAPSEGYAGSVVISMVVSWYTLPARRSISTPCWTMLSVEPSRSLMVSSVMPSFFFLGSAVMVVRWVSPRRPLLLANLL